MMDRYSQVISRGDLGMDIWDVVDVWSIDRGRRERGNIVLPDNRKLRVMRESGDTVWYVQAH